MKAFEFLQEALLKEVLTESTVGEDKLPKLKQHVVSYLKKKTKKQIAALPFIDQFKNKYEKGWGFRIVLGQKAESIRFNWSNASKIGTSSTLTSFDYWTGKEPGQNPEPSYHVKLDGNMSLVKILPMIASVINNPELLNSKTLLLPLTESFDENEDIDDLVIALMESTNAFTSLVNSLADMISTKNNAGNYPNKGDFHRIGKSAGVKLFASISDIAPEYIEKKGVSLVFNGTADQFVEVVTTNESKIASDFGGGTVSRGSGGREKIFTSSGFSETVDEAERESFEEQIRDLEGLVPLVISGATNALFVAGRGGVGKTFNVEKSLNDAGLTDGDGYYKVTGDISEAGLYTYLFQHKDDIILFDDSDGVFKSQVSRNLIKAATDTKAKRKLSWLKKASFIELYPEDHEFWTSAAAADGDDGEGDNTGDKAPQTFTFTGRIIFISNLPRDKLDPDGALRTRGFLIDINPTEKEVWDFIEKIMNHIELPSGLSLGPKERAEVVEVLKKYQKPGDPANIRKAVRGFAIRAALPNGWESKLKYA